MNLAAYSNLALGKLVLPDRVHRSVFVDPAMFDLEMERIFRRTWVYLAHQSEIRQPGDYKLATVGTEPVILSRDPRGDIHVLVNACRHRGVTLCQEALGNTKFFVCAYHGWVYDNAGRLVDVPAPQGQTRRFAPADWGLIRLPRVESYRGFLFASCNPEVPPLAEHLGATKPFLDLFVDLSPTGEIDVSSGATKYAYRGNWKQQVENSMDGYHAVTTHQSFFEGVLSERLGRSMAFIVSEESPARSVALGNGHALIDFRKLDRKAILGADKPKSEVAWHDAVRARLADPGYAEEVLRVNGGDGFNLLVYPNLVLINNQIRVIRPVRHDHTEVFAYPVTLEGVAAEINAARIRAHEDFYGPASFGAPDDLEMFARQWEGISRTPSMEWLLYERGLDREETGTADIRTSNVTDETGHRGTWQRWKNLMTGAAA